MVITIDSIIGDKFFGTTEYPTLPLGPFKFRVDGVIDLNTGVFSMLERDLQPTGNPVGILIDSVYSFSFDSTYTTITGLYLQAAYNVYGYFTLNKV